MKRSDRTDTALASQEISPTGSAGPSWAWLDALGRSLEFAADIVDAHGRPVPPIGMSRIAATLRQLVADPDSALSRAVWSAFASNHVQRATAGPLSIVCNRLNVQGAVVGVLILARETSDQPPPSQASGLTDIESIESWLTPAVEAQLGRASTDVGDDEFDRVSSLHRLLHESVEGGKEREVITAFAEALFAWDGVETSGYVEDVQGQLVLAMVAPGAVRGRAVVSLESGAAPWSATPKRMTAGDLERFGLPPDRHAVAVGIGGTTLEPWLIVFSEGYRPLNASRLVLYADLLRDALGRVSTIAETRATWAILQSLLGPTGAVEEKIEASLREMSRGLDGVDATLVVTSATGTTLLSVGNEESFSGVRSFDRGNRIVSTAHLLELGTMQLSVRRAPGQTFTRREQHLVDRAAAIFSAWLPGTLKRSTESVERRAEHQGFEQGLDRAAIEIPRDGLDVSVLVISVPDAVSRPHLLQSWVTDIRAQLRGSDLAGTISDREIGVLLSGTSQGDVPVVCARLRRRLGLDEGVVAAAIGVASRAAGSAAQDSLMGAARKNIAGLGSTAIENRDRP
jgi:hypothetical protein